MKFFIYTIILSFLHASNARIMSYNLLNFSDDNEREAHYRSIFEVISPDMIVVQEIIGQTGFLKFKSDVLDIYQEGQWSSTSFINQSAQQDIALFYKQDIFSFISTSAINTAQSSGTRDVIEWTMIHNNSDIEFNIYGVHLKASSGSSNASQRLEEATILREHLNGLPLGRNFIVAGDFNIYSNSSSSEPAFNMLTGESDNNVGRLFDPINRIGNWHNNSSFSDVHTQSPRTTSFGGGANGGMDDRFDWLFVSDNILNNESNMVYVEESYTTFGNDGNHFNSAINSGNNFSVSDEIADALHDASDHLPVYMDVWFDDLVFSDQGIIITEIMANPSSVSDSYGEWFEIANSTDTSISISGWSIKDSGIDSHIIESDYGNTVIEAGQFFVLARNGDVSSNGGVYPDYVYDGFSLSNTEDQITLMDSNGAIVDEVHYTNSWDISSGLSIEIHDLESDNNLEENWFLSTLPYGFGDYGTPGNSYEGILDIKKQHLNPGSFTVSHLFPNPFNASTVFRIFSEQSQIITIQTFDLSGRELHDKQKKLIRAGNNDFTWSGSNYVSGIYILRISSPSAYFFRKLVLVK